MPWGASSIERKSLNKGSGRALGAGLAVLLTLAGAGIAAAQDGRGSAIEAQVQPCFTPPLVEAAQVRIAVTLAPDGAIEGSPTVVESGESEGDRAFAAAALRAVLRCAPFDAGGVSEVVFRFAGMSGPEAAPHTDLPSDFAASLPPDLCIVDRTDGHYQSRLWRNAIPPASRGFGLEALAIDCETLEAAKAGRPDRPKAIANLMRSSSPAMPGDTLAGFVAEMDARQEDLPPSGQGTGRVGRDEWAAYIGHRDVDENGNLKLAGISAFTFFDGVPWIVSVVWFDGRDMGADLLSASEAMVRRLHQG